MKEIRTEDAVGLALAHDHTQIIKGVKKGPAFKKGHIVTKEDIPVLLSMGKEHLYVWEEEEGMIHENEAARVLYQMSAGSDPLFKASDVSEGKIEVIAQADGVLHVDIERLLEVNLFGEMMIATKKSFTPVKKGDKLAGMRIIPLTIEQEKMSQIQKQIGDKPLLSLNVIEPKKVGVINTGSEVLKGRIKDEFTPVLKEKLAAFGSAIVFHEVYGDEPSDVTAAIKKMIAEGAEMVLVTGGMSVDPDDKTPLAIKQTGAEIVTYGTPVLPGAMLMLAYYDGKLPVMGLPGSVMFAPKTVFDLILPRILAGEKLTPRDIAALGHGGLLA